MAEDRWQTVAVLILEYVHENGGQFELLSVGEIAVATRIDPKEVAVELDSLSDAPEAAGTLGAKGAYATLSSGGADGPS
jgi:hypothetical protein